MNRDGKPDLVADSPENARGTVHVLLGFGDGSFPTHVKHEAGVASQAIAVGDVHDAGKLDLVMANAIGNYVCASLNNGRRQSHMGSRVHHRPRDPFRVAPPQRTPDGVL